jgi:hypothetical protein
MDRERERERRNVYRGDEVTQPTPTRQSPDRPPKPQLVEHLPITHRVGGLR